MAWTATTFKARWTEFAPTEDARVVAVLTAAARRCAPSVFGADTDEAVGLYAAHLLATSPHGMQARQEGDDTTTYYAEWARLARQRAGGPWSVGQGPGGMLR